MENKDKYAGTKICPRCGEPKMREPEAMNALSRRDNKTYICSDCGTDEAMVDFTLYEHEKKLKAEADEHGITQHIKDEIHRIDRIRFAERQWLVQ